MSIDKDIPSLNRNSYKESTTVANQPGKVVINPDGTNVGTSAGIPSTTGQKTMANSLGVVIASDQSAIPITSTDLGTTADASASTDTGTFSLISLIKRLLTKLPGLGQAVMASSQPVVIASNQSTLPINGATASATANAGNPVKIAAVNNTTSPTYTDGQVGDLQMNTRGALLTTLMVQNSGTAMRNLADNVDAVAVSSTAFNLTIMGRNTVYNGTTWDRQPGNTVGAFSAIKGGLMPDSTALNTYAVRITTNTTTTPTASLGYISSIGISTESIGTTSTIKIQDKSGTPLVLVPAVTTTTAGLTIYNFQTPIKMTGGIDVITAGAAAATVDVWINYYQ